MITRKIGKLVRGKATPFQVFTAALLGAAIAFLPSFDKAAGLYLLLGGLLLVLNANLGVAALVAVPAKLVSLAALPASFAVGRLALDGPTSGLLRKLINMPVLAYFGFETYVTTGGLVLGLLFGTTAGLGLVAVLQRLRRTFVRLEGGSTRYQELVTKRWVKLAVFVFVGGSRGKKSYAELLTKRVGNPVRIWGAAVVAAGVVLLVAFHGLLTSSMLARLGQRGLERINGATVDLAGLELDLAEGRLHVDGLAMADRNRLDLDVFRGLTIEADLSMTDLLRKRVAIEQLVIRNASSGERREVPGQRVGPEQDAEAPAGGEPAEGEVSLEQVVEDAKLWRERLATARRWLERLAPTGSADDEPGGQAGETLRERLERQAREMGYAEVVASHLIDETPRLAIGELVVEGLRVASLEGEVLTVRATSLSSDPHLSSAGPRIEVRSQSGRIELELGLDGLASEAASDGNRLRLALSDLQVDEVAAGVVVGDRRPVSGGTVDLLLDGGWSGGRAGHLDLPLQVTLHDTTLHLPGQGPTQVERLALPIALRGPLDAPSIRVDDDALTQALVDAGKAELARRVREEAATRLQGELAEQGLDAGKLGQEANKKAGALLGGFLDGR